MDASMKRCVRGVLLILALLSLAAAEGRSQEWVVAINPGLKMGWVLGEGGGPFYGVEISLSAVLNSYDAGKSGGYGFGLVFNRYSVNGRRVTHVGVEAMYRGLGLQAGPTFVRELDGGSNTGISVEGFYGAIVFAHAERTFMFDGTSWWHAGFYGKLPIPIAGRLKGLGPG